MAKSPRYNPHRFRNGSRVDHCAMRRCRNCGGCQYDWGVGMSSDRKRQPYVMMWYCCGRGGCGYVQYERMNNARLMDLRQRPTFLEPAQGAPWR